MNFENILGFYFIVYMDLGEIEKMSEIEITVLKWTICWMLDSIRNRGIQCILMTYFSLRVIAFSFNLLH